MKRVNFAADMVGDASKPGVRSIVDRLKAQGDLSPEEFVDTCLDLMGPVEVREENRRQLVEHAGEAGPLRWTTGGSGGPDRDGEDPSERVAEMLQLIVSTREFQYA